MLKKKRKVAQHNKQASLRAQQVAFTIYFIILAASSRVKL